MAYELSASACSIGHLRFERILENTDLYAQLINLRSDERHAARARNLEEETKPIEAGFEHARYNDKDEVAIYRKRK